MILALLRVVNSPFGRVLQAIRENRFRAEALGFRTVFHLTYANCLAALVAASAGMLNALWLRYAGPDTSLSFAIMLDILLMVVIGGMGTIYGAIIGAVDLHPGAELSAGADGGGLQRGGRGRLAAAAGTAASRSLAVVAGAVVHRQRLFLSDRRCGTTTTEQAVTNADKAFCLAGGLNFPPASPHSIDDPMATPQARTRENQG